MKPYTPNTPGYDFIYGCDKAELCADINGAKISFPHSSDGGYTAHLWFG